MPHHVSSVLAGIAFAVACLFAPSGSAVANPLDEAAAITLAHYQQALTEGRYADARELVVLLGMVSVPPAAAAVMPVPEEPPIPAPAAEPTQRAASIELASVGRLPVENLLLFQSGGGSNTDTGGGGDATNLTPAPAGLRPLCVSHFERRWCGADPNCTCRAEASVISGQMAAAEQRVRELNGLITTALREGNAADVRKYEADLASLLAGVVPKDIGWDEPLHIGLYAGVEGTTLQDIGEEATARVGLIVYKQQVTFRLAEDPLVDGRRSCLDWRVKVPSNGGGDPSIRTTQVRSGGTPRSVASVDVGIGPSHCGFGFGLHGYMSAFLTSTAERSAAEGDMAMVGMDSPMQDTGDQREGGVQQAFEAELGIFAPVLQTRRDRYGRMLAGPILMASLAEDGLEEGRFDRRYYGGVRLAHSPEMFFDVLYGKTEGLEGQRMEVRGQVPVLNLSGDARVMLGGAANFGVRDNDEDPDSLRVFLTWNTGLGGILGD